MDELRAILKDHRFAFLYENVKMSQESAKIAPDSLGVQPLFVCPCDFGWVSRPRLWWLDAPLKCFNPHDGAKLHGGTRNARKARKRDLHSDTNLEAGC